MNFNISVHKLTNHNQIIAQENSVLMGFYNNNRYSGPIFITILA